jgi:hypothetical protein
LQYSTVSANLGHIGEVKLRVHALHQKIQTDGAQIDVAGPFAVAQQAAFYAVGTGEHTEFGSRDGHALIIVRVQRQHHCVTLIEIAGHKLDLVGKDVRGGHLHGIGQVDDNRTLRSGSDDINHRIADLQ